MTNTASTRNYKSNMMGNEFKYKRGLYLNVFRSTVSWFVEVIFCHRMFTTGTMPVHKQTVMAVVPFLIK